MNRRFRLLPFTMFAVLMLLAIRTADLIRGGEEFAHALLIGNVMAQDEQPKKEEKPADTSTEAAKEGDAKPKEGEAQTASSGGEKPKEGEKEGEGAAKEGEHAEGEGEGEGKKKEKPKPGGGHISEAPPKEEEGSAKSLSAQARYFSPVEMDILQNLGKRREQLDGWDKEVEIKENLLANVEKRIDEKLTLIQGMKKDLQEMLTQYNEQEDAKIRSLVKIYENMKPRDAARIFDEVEMPVLLLVIDRMKEKKAAPILASMDSKKAKQLTVELAEERRLKNAKMQMSPPPAAPPAPAASR